MRSSRSTLVEPLMGSHICFDKMVGFVTCSLCNVWNREACGGVWVAGTHISVEFRGRLRGGSHVSLPSVARGVRSMASPAWVDGGPGPAGAFCLTWMGLMPPIANDSITLKY